MTQRKRTPATHVVRPGETLTRLADLYGLADPSRIWNHRRNSFLGRRRSYAVLLPGDRVFVPEADGSVLHRLSGKRMAAGFPVRVERFG